MENHLSLTEVVAEAKMVYKLWNKKVGQGKNKLTKQKND